MTLRFAAIGLSHDHIYGLCDALLRGGAELVAIHEPSDALATRFVARFPQARRVATLDAVLDDHGIATIACAAANPERAGIAITALRRGKDVLMDKPAVTSLAELGAVEAAARESGRRFLVMFGERFENRATVAALRLVADGAIGTVLHMTALGPHRLRAATRPPWFFERRRSGGILCDIGAHHFDLFVHLAGARPATVVAARTGNRAHPQWPEFEDVGECLVEAGGLGGFMRVDWFTPDAMPAFGDGRLFLVGTAGTLELRKYVDIAGRPGGDHLFLADGAGTRHIDCGGLESGFGARLVADLRDGTERVVSQAHGFAACRLALAAQAIADAAGGAP
ncbi:MAG: Gfo/Idh/MocA family oxidoreductase [Alphaproteobacteria bacterium]|nr:Gfo/Idh/MocA family oxidoreductase [Alphaproteobacteria bacterium]